MPPKFRKLESRQSSGNQLCRCEKLNPKVVVRIAENQPNLYQRSSEDSGQAAPTTSANGGGEEKLQ